MVKHKLVQVIWRDITTTASWTPKDRTNEIETAICKSVGWLIEQTSKVIKVAGSQNDDDWGNIDCIPVANVIEIRELRKK